MSSKKVFTNISANPVVLSDGSSVQPGETTTEAQYELAKGSFWEQHGLLVSGEPKLTDDAGVQLDELINENDRLTQALFAANAKVQKLESDAKVHPDQLKDLQDKLTQEQARSSKLESDYKALQAKK